MRRCRDRHSPFPPPERGRVREGVTRGTRVLRPELFCWERETPTPRLSAPTSPFQGGGKKKLPPPHGATPMDSYLLLKTIHLVGVVIFLGNIIVTAWWKVMADRTRDPKIIAFAQRQVTLTDWVFTFGGVTLVAIGGYGNAALHGIPLTLAWLAWGNALFILSGVIWVAILIPVQTKLARIVRTFA